MRTSKDQPLDLKRLALMKADTSLALINFGTSVKDALQNTFTRRLKAKIIAMVILMVTIALVDLTFKGSLVSGLMSAGLLGICFWVFIFMFNLKDPRKN